MTILLNGSDLTVTQVVAAARHREPVRLRVLTGKPGDTLSQLRRLARKAETSRP